ncbi:MAG: HAD-IA family hydrolase [Saccharospirillaceae bacterium]|nr:HAD-IA family hydrolase [Saccharospirillaceae bacterium]MCD8532320.1 HAD-IA family hydrolase [Saccharospirillaceae bacterium]
MSLTRPKAILFDLDGTLVDTAPDFYDVVNSLRKEQGKPALANGTIREQVSNGGAALTRLTFDYPDQTGRDLATAPQIFLDQRQQILDRYLQSIGLLSGYFPGFPEVITTLEQQGIRWGIVTNKPRLYTEALLAKLAIQGDVVVCPDDVTKSKPHPEPLLKAAADLGLQAADCWYVGDHIRDIDAARAAGMISIAATFGYIESGDHPEHWQADLQISHPHDLITLLQATL